MKRMSTAELKQTTCAALRCVAVTLLLAGILQNTAVACPFCLAPGQTWAEMVVEADVVIFAELLSNDDGSTGNAPQSIVKVLQVHKGSALLPKDGRITVPEYIFGEVGATVLLKASVQDLSQPVINETFVTDQPTPRPATKAIQKVSATASTTLLWDFSEPQSWTVYDYILNAPSPELATSERLIYFAAFLEHRDSLIASDAWGEFANAQYQDIVGIRQSLPVHDLRTWIANPATSPDRLGLYGMLLGLCGDASDIDFLKRLIGQPVTDELRFGTEGLMGGLLLLAGQDGLTFLEESRLRNSATPTFECFPVLQALQFVWTYEPDRFEKETLRKALHPLLRREDVREIVIRDLARWEDWHAVQVLPEVYQASRQDDPRTVKAIVGFLLVCRKADGADATSVVAAEELLETIRTDNSRLVRSVQRELGGD